MSLKRLREIHEWVRSQSVLNSFTMFTRWMLAIGFIPPGLTKILGNPFTIISPETPIGAFFEAFFQSGLYYGFVGLGQVVAGLLLLNRRTSLWGAILYFPILANILVITWTMGFRGTWMVVGFMLLANLYLFFWHFDRLQALFVSGPIHLHTEKEWRELCRRTPQNQVLRLGGLALTVGLICLAALLAAGRGFLPSGVAVLSLCLGVSMTPLLVAAFWELLRSRISATGPSA